MLKKSYQILCLVLLFVFWQTPQTQAFEVKVRGNFQEIKLYQKDLNTWIKTPQEFTSIAFQVPQKIDLKLILNPKSNLVKQIDFEEGFYSDLTFNNPTKAFLLENQEEISALNFPITAYLFDTRKRGNTWQNLSSSTVHLNGLKVISRQEWGADESLRYYNPEEIEVVKSSNQGSISKRVSACNAKIKAYPEEYKYVKTLEKEGSHYLVWPFQYSAKIKKIVIHHTGETNVQNGRPSDEMMRAIYYYHTVVRGWGDIGYHYVIGKDGEIFEGKAGGDKVVGAHVYCNNIGTVGVSVMGNFEKESPKAKQITSLKAVVSQLAQRYNLNVMQESVFHGKKQSNLLGHRDLGATACPGKNLYKLLPQIRKEVASGFTYKFEEENVSKKSYDAEVKKKIEVLKLDPTQTKTIVLKFKNTGTKIWQKTTWLHVALNNNENVYAESIVPNKKFVAADLIEKEVRPGGIGSFRVTIQAGYQEGFYILEFAPVVNNKYKLSQAAIMQPIEVNQANYSYKFIKAQHPPNPFYAEQNEEAWIELKNTGNIVWRNYGEHKIYLGTENPQDRNSLFSEDGRKNRLGYLLQREVLPGQIGRFIMPLTAPERAGIYTEHFAPVIEGIKWLQDVGMNFRIVVKKPQYNLKFLNKSRTIQLNPGEKFALNVRFKNESDINWKADQLFFRLAGSFEELGIEDNLIHLKTDLTTQKEDNFKLEFEAPLRRGYYRLSIVPIIRGKKFTEMTPLKINIFVKKPSYKGELLERVKTPQRMDQNEVKKIQVKIKNTGNLTWNKFGKDALKIVTTNQRSRMYVKDKWESKNIVASLQENTVKPGEIGSFEIYLNTKYRGYYYETFKLKAKSTGIVKGVLIPLKTIIAPPMIKITQQQQGISQVGATRSITKTENQMNLTRILLSVPQEPFYQVKSQTVVDVFDLKQKRVMSVPANQVLTVRKAGNFINLKLNSVSKVVATGVKLQGGQGSVLEIVNWQHAPAWNKNLNDNKFRNALEFRIIENQIKIINELPLENYLKGIAEVSNSDPLEKLKTMAVLARSYALFYMQEENEKFPGQPYDGSDDPNVFQKYLGYGLEQRSPNFVQAIESTKNEVVKYKNQLVKTPYFNQSDGRTLSAEEVWGWTHTPYLQSVPDPYCKNLVRKGHGVGLSGYGATQMAKDGKTYKEIIQYYYPGVKIENY